MAKRKTRYLCFSLAVNCENDAFSQDLAGEIARICDNVAKQVRNGVYAAKIQDSNGNQCGHFGFNNAEG